MTKTDGLATVSDLIAQMNADPEWVAKRAEEQRLRAEQIERLRQEQAPLVAALAEVGIKVRSVWDLVKTSSPDPNAFPILLEHIGRPYSSKIIEGIARSLAVRSARTVAWEPMLKLARSLPDDWDEYTRDSLFVAISAMARPDDLPVLISLISDVGMGSHRLFFVRNLMRSKRAEARETLLRLKGDPDLRKEIAARLRL